MAARTSYQHRWLLFCIFYFRVVVTVSAANNSSIADIWPDLADVPAEPKRDGVSYASGGLLFAVCCNQALREAVHMVDGEMEFIPGQTLLHGDINVFRNDESPCTG
jgi:hypothetical protein